MPAVMRQVLSSDISQIGYNFESKALIVVWLRSGRVSLYADVPEKTAEETINAWSVGTAVKDNIKPFFPHRYIRAVDIEEEEAK